MWLGTTTHAITVPAQEEMSIISIEVDPSASVRGRPASFRFSDLSNRLVAAPFMVSKTDCEKEDEADCKDFCGQLEQTSACKASGNKVTCFCKGGKGGESKCEERCLFCMSRVPLHGHHDLSNSEMSQVHPINQRLRRLLRSVGRGLKIYEQVALKGLGLFR
jgi:hypothetical protein